MHAPDSVTVNFTTKGDGVPESPRHADKFAVNIGVWRGDGPRTQADLLLGIGLVFTLAAASLRPAPSGCPRRMTAICADLP